MGSPCQPRTGKGGWTKPQRGPASPGLVLLWVLQWLEQLDRHARSQGEGVTH